MNSYKTLFFDLDHTLWDYETNSRDTLLELYEKHKLATRGINTFAVFHENFKMVNSQLWHLYDHGNITSEIIRKERFKQILEKFNSYEVELSLKLSEDYLYICPQKGHLMPHAIETLDYLSSRYSLSVITNGFEDIQAMKLQSGDITSYFDHIITSQKAGSKKPAKEIFHFALDSHGIEANHAVMIGDNLLTDIAGAKNASIDTIFYNPDSIAHTEKVNHEINRLNELCELL